MEILYQKQESRLRNLNTSFTRYISKTIDRRDRMIGIRGARGCGKTIFLLQELQSSLNEGIKSLYVSLDYMYFIENNLVDLANRFVREGGQRLFLDEVHRYPDWGRALKNIYDDHPGLQVWFTGSSILHLRDASADLSRRAIMYTMQGLSFREYIHLRNGTDIQSFTLNEVLNNHIDICKDILVRVSPYRYFSDYLSTGYFPFFLENPNTYHARLTEVLQLVLEIDLPALRNISLANIPKLRKFLYFLSCTAPYKPNISDLSEKTGISRNVLIQYLKYFEEAALLNLLYTDAVGAGIMQKPDKIFLDNTNLMYVLAPERVNKGSLRETFLMNQLSAVARVEYTHSGDFLVNGQYTIEVGGRNKTRQQLKNVQQGWIAADDFEIGLDRKIPLWLFGFLY